MFLRSFNITNTAKEIIRVDLRHREDVRNAPIIIICHGFQAFKDWGFFPELASRLADDGYVAVTFNFSRNGIGADLHNITELEKFAINTYTHELKDLQIVVDEIVKGKISKGLLDTSKIGLLGHSWGGAIAILHASQDNRIKSLVTWSAISTIERFTEEEIKLWGKNGFIDVQNKQTKERLRINIDLLNDINKNRTKLDILKAASYLKIPTLIVHGEMDETVPASEAHTIFDHLKAVNKNLEIIEGANHTFGVRHPMGGINKQFDLVMDLTENWFDNYLNE
jgi:dienelactone hydrolase